MKKLLLSRSEYDDCVKHYVENVNIPESILHCGAHLGEEYQVYKKFGIDEIYWNEAQPNLVLQLKKLFGKSNVFQGALSEKDGETIDFFVTDNSLSSSTRIINPVNAWGIKLLNKIEVKSITLNTILRRIQLNKGKPPNLIILDLQGGEFEALSQSGIAFENQSDFVVEMAQYEIYNNQKIESDIISFFETFNYKLVYPIMKKAHYDALFLSPRSQQEYFKKIKVSKRFLSLRKSRLVDLLYVIKKAI